MAVVYCNFNFLNSYSHASLSFVYKHNLILSLSKKSFLNKCVAPVMVMDHHHNIIIL